MYCRIYTPFGAARNQRIDYAAAQKSPAAVARLDQVCHRKGKSGIRPKYRKWQ